MPTTNPPLGSKSRSEDAPTKTWNTSIYFPDYDDLQRLRKTAKARGVPLGTFIREAAMREVNRIEKDEKTSRIPPGRQRDGHEHGQEREGGVSDHNNDARTLQPSASRTALLFECTYPFAQKLAPRPASEGANYGNCFHELLGGIIENDWKQPTRELVQLCVERWLGQEKKKPEKKPDDEQPLDLDLDEGSIVKLTDEMQAHVKESAEVLFAWLRGKNPFRLDFLQKGCTVLTEVSYALSPKAAREINGPTPEDHVYEDLRAGETPGTADLVILPPKGLGKKIPILVLDHKTGMHEAHSEPEKRPQLRSLARAVSLAYGTTKAGVVVGALQSKRRNMPVVYADEITKETLATHSQRVFLQLAKVGDGAMRPGPWCITEHCPAAGVCPARDAEMLNKAGGILAGLAVAAGADPSSSPSVTALLQAPKSSALSRSKRLGLLYSVVQQSEKLAAAARREIRTEVLAGALPELPDGGYLVTRTITKENLSKASIVRAYGKLAGEKLLAKLRTEGAIESSTYDQLHVEGERGT